LEKGVRLIALVVNLPRNGEVIGLELAITHEPILGIIPMTVEVSI
jgi:hypothetical protein